MDNLLGTVLDEKYSLHELLGEGGMGRVYLGEQLRIGRKVAVKILHPWLSSDPKVAARFEREARAAGRISHPNSVTVFDFGHDQEGQLYLVMEYLEGESLQTRLLRRKRLPPKEAVALLGQILAPLSACHAAGIVHRDVKPENILLSTQGGREQVKLLDYGIARLADGPQVTKTGNVIGTPTYMSPEQIGSPSVSPATDIYATGIIAYEMLVGRPPFIEKSHLEIFRQHIKGKVPPFASLLPHSEVLKPFEPVIGKALAKNPKERYRSAEHFHVALTEAQRESFLLEESTPYHPEEALSPFRAGSGPSQRVRAKEAPVSSEQAFESTVEASARLHISVSATVDVDAPPSLGDAVTVDVESPLQAPRRTRPEPHTGAPRLPTLSLEEEVELDEEGDGVVTVASLMDDAQTSTAVNIPPLRPEDEDEEEGDGVATMVDTRARPKTLSLDNPVRALYPSDARLNTEASAALSLLDEESASGPEAGRSISRSASGVFPPARSEAPEQALDSMETALLRPVKRATWEQASPDALLREESGALPGDEEDSTATLQLPPVEEKGRPPTREFLLENVADSLALRKEEHIADTGPLPVEPAPPEVNRNDTTDQTMLPEAAFFTDPQQPSVRAPLLSGSLAPQARYTPGLFLYGGAALFLFFALLLFFWPSSEQSPGVLIQTKPEGAKILVNGEALSDETPLRHALPVGDVFLTVIREGCDPWEGLFQITPGVAQIFIPLQGVACER